MDLVGEPPGKIHEYLDAVVVEPKETDPPAVMVTSEAGEVIAPLGGVVSYGDSCTKRATDGTPALSSRNSM